METDDVESLDLSLEVKDGLKDSSLDNSLDLSPDTQQALELLKKDVKLVNGEKRNPNLEDKQASNKERETVPHDVSCMEVEQHHSCSADDEATEKLQEGLLVPTGTTVQESAHTGSSNLTSMKKTQRREGFGEVITSPTQLLEENSQLAPSHDNLSDLSPDTQQVLQQLIKDIKDGKVKLVKDERGNPKLEYEQARDLCWDPSNANVICTPKTDSDVELKTESWLEGVNDKKTKKHPSGVRLETNKITLSNRLYREGINFEKTEKVLGTGINGDIVVVRDIATGQEHALKKMMLPGFPNNEIRCWMSDTGFAPCLYLFNNDGNHVYIHMEILENAVTLQSVIDDMSAFNNDAALMKIFSLFVLERILKALSALHSRGWSHNDLHGGNVMVQKSSSESLTVKILDFGLAGQLEGQTGLDSKGIRADILWSVRLFFALNTGEMFTDCRDLKDNWSSRLKKLTSHISDSDRDELFCLIKYAMDICVLDILHLADVESFRKKVKDNLSLAMGDTPQTQSDNKKRIVNLLFPSPDFISLKQEDKTDLPIQCEDNVAAVLSTSRLLISNEERESVPLDQSCMGVENHHSSEPVDASQEHESNNRNNTMAPLAIEGGKGKKSKMFPQPAETEMPVETEVERPDDEDDNDIEPDDEEADINDRVVQFFEYRPYFYDTADERMDSKKLKDAELKAFAETIGLVPAKILRKWNNWQTYYGKLSLPEDKSGQVTVEKTRLQKWTLHHLAFLAPFIAHRSVQVIEMGGGADDEATEQLQEGSSDDESVPTVQEESARPGFSTFTSLKSKKTQQKKKFGKEEVCTSLSQLLEENSKKDTELSMTIDRSAERPSERDTLAVLLGRVEHEVPGQQFRSFETEMRELCRRYLSPESVSTDATMTTEPVLMAHSGSQLQQPDDRSTTSIPDMTMNMDSVAKDSTSDK